MGKKTKECDVIEANTIFQRMEKKNQKLGIQRGGGGRS